MTEQSRPASSTHELGLWLFMCDDGSSYRGNVRSFYEYVVANQLGLDAVWLTQDLALISMLESEGMPVAKLKSPKTRQLLTRASALICESLREDIFDTPGFHSGLKKVRLLASDYWTSGLPPSRPVLTSDVMDTFDPGRDAPWSHDWRTRTNMVVTDSRLLAEEIQALVGSTGCRVVSVPTESRLLPISETLVPIGRQHVLLDLQGADRSNRRLEVELRDGLASIDLLGREQRVFIDLLLPNEIQTSESLRQEIDNCNSLKVVDALDIYALLSQFSGAVTCSPDLAFGLARTGIPTSVYRTDVRRLGTLLDDETIRVTFGINPSQTWISALGEILDRLSANTLVAPDPTPLTSSLGILNHLQEDSNDYLFDAICQWIKGA